MPKTSVTITAAQKLTVAQRKEITTLLKPKLGEVTINEVVDPEVIGGFKLSVGNQDFDVTTQGKMKALESLLPRVTVLSAVPLAASQKSKVEQFISQKIGDAEVVEVVDPALIGGIKIIFPSEEYDASLKGKLDKLKTYMMQSI